MLYNGISIYALDNTMGLHHHILLARCQYFQWSTLISSSLPGKPHKNYTCIHAHTHGKFSSVSSLRVYFHKPLSFPCFVSNFPHELDHPLFVFLLELLCLTCHPGVPARF